MLENRDLQQIFLALPSPSLILLPNTPNFTITAVNNAYLNITNTTDEQLIGRDFLSIFSSTKSIQNSTESNNLNGALQSVLVTKSAYKICNHKVYISLINSSDFSIQYLDIEFTPVLNNEDEIIHIIQTISKANDTALSNEMELNLKKKKEELLINNTDDLIWAIDTDFKIITANNAYWSGMKMVTSRSMKEGDSAFMEEFGEELYIKWRRIYERALSGEKIEIKEQFFNVVTQSMTYGLVNLSPIYDDNGKIIGAACYNKDITKDTENLLLLENAKEEMRLILDSSLDLICTVSLEGTFVNVSEAAFLILGYKPIELIGQRLENFVYPEDFDATSKVGQDILAGISTTNFENRYVRKDGTIVPMLWSATWNAKSELIYCVGRDVTESKNEELQRDLFSKINILFSHSTSLTATLENLLELILRFIEFNMAEIWLVTDDQRYINLAAKKSIDLDTSILYTSVPNILKEKGLVGTTWATNTKQEWKAEKINNNSNFNRAKEALEIGIKEVYTLPLTQNETVIAVLLIGSSLNKPLQSRFNSLFNTLGTLIGAEIKRKKLEEDLNKIFSFAPDILCIAGMDGYFKKINQAATKLLEYSEEELLAVPYSNFVHIDDVNKTYAESDGIQKGKTSQYFENRYITKSGKVKWLAWNSTPVTEEGLVYGMAVDITEKKVLEESLNYSNQLARIGSWEIDFENNTVYWSTITKEIYEVEKDYIPTIENGINFYKDEESRAKIIEILNNTIESGIDCDFVLPVISAKGNRRWIRVIGKTQSINNKCIKISGSVQDVTILKENELELLALNSQLTQRAKELANSNKELEHFAYIASHDLQEPLRMISSFLLLIEEKYADKIDDKGKQYIAFAVDGAKRMKQIILDLLQFSRVGVKNETLEDIDVSSLIQEINLLHNQQIEEINAKIYFNDLPRIQSYKTPLRQVLQNLISNALKYHNTETQPIINISITDNTTHWQFCVEDNGIGIDPEYFDKIFVIFKRLHSKEAYSGTGIGLAIVKKIIESLDGTIWVHSAEGKGSKFYFTIKK